MVFEWDEDKNIANIRKHGISFDDAVFAFKDPYLLEAYDKKHSSLDEDRWYAIGFAERILCVVFTERLGTIRIILYLQDLPQRRKEMSTTKRITLDELQSMEMSEDSKRRIRNAEPVLDEENPPLTEEELESLQPAINRHPEWFRPKKADVHLKIDIDVLEAFKAKGKGYQTRINEVLREYVFNSNGGNA